MVKHSVAQVGFYLDGSTKQRNTPQETADNHAQNYDHHGHADFVQQEIHSERRLNSIHHDKSLVHAVDDHLVQVGDN